MGEYLYKTSEDFLRTVSERIVAQSDGKLELPDEELGAAVFSTILQQAVQQGFHTVLLMDSFDNIVKNKSFDPEFFRFFRSSANVKEVSYVTTSIAPLRRICHDAIVDSPFFNLFYIYHLEALTSVEAQQLVQIPSRLAGCPFTDAETTWVLSLAGHHPFFIQRVCFFLFEEKIAGGETPNLNKVKGQVYNDLLPHFNHIWEHLNTEERLKYEALLSKDVSRQPSFSEFSESDLFRDFVLEKAGMPFFNLNVAELEKALQHLDNSLDLGTSPLRYLSSVAKRLKGNSTSTTGIGRVVREVLNEALQRLRGYGVQTDITPDWRTYNILYYRYFRKHLLTNEEIAARIGFSKRQYYRERSKAIEELLNVLLEMEALAKVKNREK